ARVIHVLRETAPGEVSVEQLGAGAAAEALGGAQASAATGAAGVGAPPTEAAPAAPTAAESIAPTAAARDLPQPFILQATQPHLQLRAYIDRYKGKEYLHVREWYPKGDEHMPSPKGVVLLPETIDGLIEALTALKSYFYPPETS